MKLKPIIAPPVYFVAAIFAVFALNWILPFELNHFGILPRTISGLKGILFAPFLHANFVHIASNTVPAFVLMLLLYSFYPKQATKVIVFSALIGGSFVWIFARSAIHIGASGLIYSLAAFLVAAGFYKKKLVEILLSVGVLLFYSGLIWGVFPTRAYVSWEGHLFGAIAGIIVASLLLKGRASKA